MPQSIKDRKFPNNAPCTIIFSADFELAWAWRFAKTFSELERRQIVDRERNNFETILTHFNLHRIPVTWATVGHLFLNECAKNNHAWMSSLNHFENKNWLFNSGHWFDQDPNCSYKEAPHWYAPDLIEMILASPVKHEIACHSFSHIAFNDEICSPLVAMDELKACVMEAKKWGIDLESFVFPGGTYGNFKQLKSFGFTNYRMNQGFDLFYPYLDEHELVVLPSSLNLDDNGLNFSKTFYLMKVRKFVLSAIRSHSVCHFWFHPSMSPYYLENILPKVLAEILKLCEQFSIPIMTMGEMSRFIRSNSAT
jgi:hypothetical protein